MILIWYFSIFFIYTIWRFCESQESLFSITLSFVLIEKMWWVKSREQIVSFLCSVSSYLFQPLLFAFLVLINIMTHIWLHKVIKNGGSKIKDLILNSRWLEPWEKLKILIFEFLIFFFHKFNLQQKSVFFHYFYITVKVWQSCRNYFREKYEKLNIQS